MQQSPSPTKDKMTHLTHDVTYFSAGMIVGVKDVTQAQIKAYSTVHTAQNETVTSVTNAFDAEHDFIFKNE